MLFGGLQVSLQNARSCVGLVSYLPASRGCPGSLDASFWATECLVPWLVCWIALRGAFPVLTRSPLTS